MIYPPKAGLVNEANVYTIIRDNYVHNSSVQYYVVFLHCMCSDFVSRLCTLDKMIGYISGNS